MADERPDNSEEGSDDKAILAEALERFAYAEEVDGENRRNQLDDTKFVYEPGAQWDRNIKDKRKKWKAMCLQFNQLRPFVAQVTNDQRQGRPGVRFSPASGDASDKVAELKQELVRGIELKSDAESAYDTGFQHAVVGGRGYWRIRTDYESRKSFNQCIKIDRLPDPQAVRIDPDYQAADASDMQWAFVVQPIKKTDYERKYKDKPLSWRATQETGLWYPSGEDEKVFIADYYRLVKEDADLVLLSDGSVMWADELEAAIEAGKVAPGVKVTKERKGERVRCEWYTLGGGEQVLEKHPWKGSYVPIILCSGDEIVIEGKRVYQGLIRHAREPQQLLNYSMSQMAQRLALTPKAPFMGAVEAVKGFERLYESSNEEEYALLPYNHKDEAGEPLPMPVRQPGSDIDAGWAQFAGQMIQQVRATLGMFEDAIGMRGQAQSGRAILAREKQGDNATFHFLDNLKRALQHTGRVIDDLIPHYYDSERMVALVANDGQQKLAKVNEQIPMADPAAEGVVRYMTNPDNDLTRGEYAVSVESGPSYATKKEETRATLVELFQAFPPAAQVLGDKLVQVIDMPDAKAAAERMQLLLPPAIQAMEAAKKEGKNPPDPAMLQQMQQLQGQIQQAGQIVQQLQAENQQLKSGQQAKMAEAQMDMQTDQQKAALEAQQAERDAQLKAQTAVQTKLIEVAGQIFAQQLAPQPQAEGVAEEAIEQQPMVDMQTILAGIQQVAEALGQSIGAAMTAPRQLAVQYDEAGNVVGGVSQVVQG
jgi:hypothetical protein